MRRPLLLVVLSAAFASAGVASGCSSSHGAPAGDAGTDSYGVIVGGGDGAAADSPGETTTTVQATMRLVHASTDLGPVDFCWRPTGAASWNGPVLAGSLPPVEGGPVEDAAPGTDAAADAGEDSGVDAGAGPPLDAGGGDAVDEYDAPPDAIDASLSVPDAAPPGVLEFGTIAPAVHLAASGTMDLALVAVGSRSCANRLFEGKITLDAGKRATAVIMGLAAEDGGAAALSIVAFTDAPSSNQAARVRMIHAALGTADTPPAPPLEVRAGTAVIAQEVDPKQVSAASATLDIDSLGYASLGALAPPTALQLQSAGDAAPRKWSTGPEYLGAELGSSHTGIVVSLDATALGVVWCSDDPGPTGAATTCSLFPAP